MVHNGDVDQDNLHGLGMPIIMQGGRLRSISYSNHEDIFNNTPINHALIVFAWIIGVQDDPGRVIYYLRFTGRNLEIVRQPYDITLVLEKECYQFVQYLCSQN